MRLRTLFIGSAVFGLMATSTAIADTGFVANIDGLQEVPPAATPGFGTGSFILNTAQTELAYDISYSGLLANRTAAHIHDAPEGTNGSVKLTLGGSGGTSGTFTGLWTTTQPTTPLTAAHVTSLFAGRLYVNIHTSVYAGGEIRGQIFLDATPNHSTSWGRIKSLYR